MGDDHKRKPSTWAKKSAARAKLLGQSPSVARTQLINSLIRRLFEDESGEVYCFRCGEEIEDSFHIDHKESWQLAEEPLRLYFDTDNVMLSHPSCNSAAHESYRKRHRLSLEERVLRHRAANQAWKRKRKLRLAETG